VKRAEQLGGDVAVFSGWSSTGGESEAEQMRSLWTTPGPELILEPRARNTAENASYSLALLLEHGGVDAATIVCSIRHRIRVPYLFGALFRQNGIEPSYEFVRRPLPPPGIWFQEAVGLALMPKHRRQAGALLGGIRQCRCGAVRSRRRA